MRTTTRLTIAVAAAAATAVSGYAIAAATDDEPETEPLGPEPVTVVIDVEHSKFVPDSLRVEAGTEVRFVLMNDDPINHELIVGPQAVHDRHAEGTEATHPPKPGELSVGPGEQGVTSYTFHTPGEIEMACHLPGHYDFGMHGTIEVVENPEHDSH